MNSKDLKRPDITDFIHGELSEAHKQYSQSLDLWNYTQALDAYCDELENKLTESVKDDNVEMYFLRGGKQY